MIVDLGCALINYYAIETLSSQSYCLIEHSKN